MVEAQLQNRIDVYLVDGTYELFRYFFAVPSAKDGNGQEIGAVRGVLTSILSMIENGATHVESRPITWSSRFAMICISDTRPAKVYLRNCFRNFRFWKRRCKPW